MRFNTPEEVKVWAARAAAEDYRLHQLHGSGLNPFSTEGARNDWQRGFDNMGPRSYERREGQSDEEAVAFDTMYQRGQAMALLLQSKEVSDDV